MVLAVGQGLPVGGAEAVEHEGDAGDVVVGGADEGEEALRGVLPVDVGGCVDGRWIYMYSQPTHTIMIYIDTHT